jgi:2-polyprenyl-3-methyl-5-hydroxy-6-metoxy-1,4-benzoquinol methylase
MNYQNKPEGYYDVPRTEMFAFFPEGATRILEIGCAEGSFSKNLKNSENEVLGY